MYLVDLTQKSEETDSIDRLQESKVERLEPIGESAPATSIEPSRSLEHDLSIATMLGTGSIVPMSVVTTHVLFLEPFVAIPILLATVAAAPLGVLAWRMRGFFRRKRSAGSPLPSPAAQLKALNAPAAPATTVYTRSDRAPRYRSRGNHWRSSVYGDSYWQGYMDSIYCDYEDNHLKKPSNYDHY